MQSVTLNHSRKAAAHTKKQKNCRGGLAGSPEAEDENNIETIELKLVGNEAQRHTTSMLSVTCEAEAPVLPPANHTPLSAAAAARS